MPRGVRNIAVPGEQAAEAAKAPAQAEAQGPQPTGAELPRAAEIDVESLKAPVLTQDGWLCPPERFVPPTRAL